MTECAVLGLGSSNEAEHLSKHFLREEFPGFGKNEQGIISCDFFPDESQKYPFHIYSFLSWIWIAKATSTVFQKRFQVLNKMNCILLMPQGNWIKD
jgi:hypothetical protein